MHKILKYIAPQNVAYKILQTSLIVYFYQSAIIIISQWYQIYAKRAAKLIVLLFSRLIKIIME